MLAEHPELTLVIETTGKAEQIADLRRDLPVHVALVERAAASFFVRLLASDQMWVACKLDPPAHPDPAQGHHRPAARGKSPWWTARAACWTATRPCSRPTG